MTDNRFQGLRAVLRNAVTWGAAWAVAGGALVTTISLFDPSPGIESLLERLGLAILSGIAWGVRFGLAGAVIGTVFASVIRLGYRGRRLADINPVRFAMLGAVVGGVGVPLYLQTMNVLTGGGMISWGLVTDDALWATVFGAAAAAGSILLARRADAPPHGPRPDQLERVDDLDGLPAARQREPSLSQPSRSAPH
jgi:MFS family permease